MQFIVNNLGIEKIITKIIYNKNFTTIMYFVTKNYQYQKFAQSFGNHLCRELRGDDSIKQKIFEFYNNTVIEKFPELKDTIKPPNFKTDNHIIILTKIDFIVIKYF